MKVFPHKSFAVLTPLEVSCLLSYCYKPSLAAITKLDFAQPNGGMVRKKLLSCWMPRLQIAENTDSSKQLTIAIITIIHGS